MIVDLENVNNVVQILIIKEGLEFYLIAIYKFMPLPFITFVL
ncbi:unnamed protein product [marine sediment metagenome]|uniref:Uncharacterized protein n=1 Tax=marine sediment metagenome TaxID=412755 RepID=X1DJ68_9ZZZZ